MTRAALLLLALVTAAPAAPQCTAQWTHGPQKIRPYSREKISPPGPLVCARNSYCSFQVVVEARGRECSGTSVGMGEIRGRAGETIPSSAITIYRQDFVNVFYRSSEQGDIGEWPDPLIPAVDPDYSERRKAFPVNVGLVSPAYKRYGAKAGRAISKGRSSGLAFSSGEYFSHRYQRFVLQVTRGGRLGEARFQWWSQPGPVQRSLELPVQPQALALADGIAVRFEGQGNTDDFHEGDEFWIFAGPARRQPVWVDVFIPRDAPPGNYHSTMEVHFESHEPVRFPIQMEIARASLPVSSSLATHFGFYLRGTYEFHYGFQREDGRMRELARAYMRAGLRNRITLETAEDFDPAFEFHEDGSIRKADYSRFDKAWSEFLDGSGGPHGARWTSLRVPRFRRLGGLQLTNAIRDFAAHAREKGWLDRVFDYTSDEPNQPRHYDALRQRARALQAAAPEIPRLVTTYLQKDLVDTVTRWCPIVEDYFAQQRLPLGPRSLLAWWRARNVWRPTPADYEEHIRAGDSLWLYISCMGHGCAEAGRYPAQKDWPTYVIDAPAIVNQLAGTLAGTTPGVTGLLFWDVTYGDHHEGGAPRNDLTPWESTYYFGGNGEGSLLYPGLPEIVGGKTHIPIESLRLKFIRESFVDAELVRMAQAGGRGAQAADSVRAVLRGPTDWNPAPAAWAALREKLIRTAAIPSP